MPIPKVLHDNPPPQDQETEAMRLARIARERAIIERGEADLGAGQGIAWAAAREWLLALDHDPGTPEPHCKSTPG